LKFGDPVDASFGKGDSVWVDVQTDSDNDDAGPGAPLRTA